MTNKMTKKVENLNTEETQALNIPVVSGCFDINVISEFMRWTAKKTYLYTFSELQQIDGWLTKEEIILCGTPKDRAEFRRTTKDLFTEFLNNR